ncbi:MAG: response regulator [Burkholderiales bacterium]|nr:MAG: response regulator [Burkholderiales bacterium]
MNEPLRILVVEDSEADFELLAATLARQGLRVLCARVEDESGMRAALAAGGWDAVISDHNLPRFSSGEALATLQDVGAELPFIIVSGEIGEEAAVEAMRRGADDYLYKGRLARLGPALSNAIGAAETRRERKAAERALLRSEQRLRELATHLQSAVEEERRAIAREIHDDIGGTLTALRFDLRWIARHGAAQVAERARTAIETLDRAAHATQNLLRDLRPPALDDGIVAALEWQVRQFGRRTEIDAVFRSNVDALQIDGSLAMTLYRVAQEALTNVAKHAGATRVAVDLISAGDVVSLEVSDDGRGFDAEARGHSGSLGLLGLHERARKAGGWLEVSSSGRGSTVLLTLPASDAAAAALAREADA